LSGVSLHTPVSKLNDALPLMADIALRPTFSSEELERKKKVYLNTLLQAYDQPNAIAYAMFTKTMWGAEHPYGRPALGTEQSIRLLTTEDLKSFHAACFHAGNATLVVVGDVTANNLLPKLESAFGGWKKKETRKAVAPQPKQVADRTIYLVDKPGSAQSVIRIGRIGAPRTTEDYFPMVVMNTLLGGSFTSRLNMNLREKHGYTYGAGSSFDFRRVAGPFGASSSVQTAVTDKALTEFMNEFNGILKPIPDDDAVRARNYLALGYPDNFQSVAQIAGAIQELVAYGLPDTYFNTYIANVLAVKKADMERAAAKYIDPAKVAIIVVGDRSVIEKGIKDLNLGPIVNLTIEDVLGKKPMVEVK
jgi:predicted Zn-dependent peptidase